MTQTLANPKIDFLKYRENVLRSGLVQPAKLNLLIAEIESSVGALPTDPTFLAQRLINEKLITPWQHRHLMRGCLKGFFVGHYKLLEHIATGGMSTIYLSEHVVLGRKVAIKVLDPARIADRTFLKRFYLEMKALAIIDHSHVVRVYDCGVLRNKFHYLVMEYIDGPDLQKKVELEGPLPFEDAVHFIGQAAKALAVIHDQGMIHRDVKPGNLLLAPDGTIKLLDLGIVRLLSKSDTSLTIANHETLLGTVDYLAPEQAMDCHNVDERVDVYSLGCTLYYLLTGKPPFPDKSFTRVIVAHQSEEPKPISEMRSDCPIQLIRICQKMMAKNPDERSSSMKELIELLDKWETPANSFEAFCDSHSEYPHELDWRSESFPEIDPHQNPLAHDLLIASQQSKTFVERLQSVVNGCSFFWEKSN